MGAGSLKILAGVSVHRATRPLRDSDSCNVRVQVDLVWLQVSRSVYFVCVDSTDPSSFGELCHQAPALRARGVPGRDHTVYGRLSMATLLLFKASSYAAQMGDGPRTHGGRGVVVVLGWSG